MALNIKDSFSEVMGSSFNDGGLVEWLWFYLQKKGIISGLEGAGGVDIREKMARVLRDKPEVVREVKMLPKHYLPLKNRFCWLKNDKREGRWAVSYMRHKSFPMPTNSIGLSDWRYFIATFDLLHSDIQLKTVFLSQMRADWDAHVKEDAPFLWFCGEDEFPKCQVASKWLIENGGFCPGIKVSIDDYQDLLNFMDDNGYSKEKKQLCLAAVKRIWSQQKYRKNLKGKKQYNLILSDKAVARLDKMAKMHEMKRAQILEILLKMEDENNYYLPKFVRMMREIEE